MALCVLLSATVLEVSFILKELFIFSNFADDSERKGLSAFTGKFLSLTAVFRTQVVSGKKITVSPLSFGQKFSCDNDRRKTLVLYRRCEQYSIILSLRNKSFPRNPFEFLHIRESLVSRDLILDTRDSILERFKHRGSSFECQLTFERYCMLHITCEYM